jgi:hypothetical protein
MKWGKSLIKKHSIGVSNISFFLWYLLQVLNLKNVFLWMLIKLRRASISLYWWCYITFSDEGNQALQEFLSARNPRQQHSSTLESYLIKPIQRILKYPLLLQQLRNLTDPQADEHQHLVGECRQKLRWRGAVSFRTDSGIKWLISLSQCLEMSMCYSWDWEMLKIKI